VGTGAGLDTVSKRVIPSPHRVSNSYWPVGLKNYRLEKPLMLQHYQQLSSNQTFDNPRLDNVEWKRIIIAKLSA
jgi:hypothetical protein